MAGTSWGRDASAWAHWGTLSHYTILSYCTLQNISLALQNIFACRVICLAEWWALRSHRYIVIKCHYCYFKVTFICSHVWVWTCVYVHVHVCMCVCMCTMVPGEVRDILSESVLFSYCVGFSSPQIWWQAPSHLNGHQSSHFINRWSELLRIEMIY